MKPSIKILSPNFTKVTFGEKSVWFSYETPVAFQVGGSLYVCENIWGKTTGKHLNMICDNKEHRLHPTDFEQEMHDRI